MSFEECRNVEVPLNLLRHCKLNLCNVLAIFFICSILFGSLDIATQRAEENETLKQKVKEYERQLQGRFSVSPKYSRDEERYIYGSYWSL